MGAPKRLKQEDEIYILRHLVATMQKTFQSDFEPEMAKGFVSYDDHGYPLGDKLVAGQLRDVAYRSREAMVVFVLQLCDYLAGVKRETYSNVGAYFFGLEVKRQAASRLRYPAHQEAILDDETSVMRKREFYDATFWASPVVRAWIIVHVVQEWYEYHMSEWAEREAERIVQEDQMSYWPTP